ncbi:tyrosine-type recombinase/integrase [Fictibacillus sp. JL2B1089]|uniref:tyrosine-type recombinase/integrase n=1 Tax=Fictibacillus sp. JL2B1089 TaxID=3399565 RepID=UPI003A83C5CE
MLLKQEVELKTLSKDKAQIADFLFRQNIYYQNTKKKYEYTIMDFSFFLGKEWNEVTLQDYQKYIDYLGSLYAYKGYSSSLVNEKKGMIKRYLVYLVGKKIIYLDANFKQYLKIRDIKSNSTKKGQRSHTHASRKITPPEIIIEFQLFLKKEEYSDSSKNKTKLMNFHQFLMKNGVSINVFYEENKEELLWEQIGKYEKMLSSRISMEEIRLSTATCYLRAVQLFVKFLISRSLVSKRYTIPLGLRGRAQRRNDYVPKERMIELINAIYESSLHVTRDLSVFLIILDTGCRPIEVSNLTINDVDMVEKTLSLHCDKTERRKVKISHEVMEVIRDYLDCRNEYKPKTNHLFVGHRGGQLTPSGINIVFYNANKNAFGESLYPALAFRHTFITNALDEHNFQRVSKVIGHKDWKSTNYYVSRSKKRLLTNTLDKSPLMGMR